jgi:ABC-2 type transport system ATP-binding protein
MENMNDKAISFHEIDFSYPNQEHKLISNLSLEVRVGERFGLFGSNGAGKTTLMQIISGLLFQTKGTVQVLNNSYSNNKRHIQQLLGFVPQDYSFYFELTPKENLQFFGAWYGMESKEIVKMTSKLLNILGLEHVANKRVGQFSGGMKRRINLAIGVMHQPKLLLLDEPTVGVDVQTRNAIISFLKQINQEGTTLFYTSHQLAEAEELCESIAMIDDGKIIIKDTLANLKATYSQDGLEGLFLNLTGKAYRDA